MPRRYDRSGRPPPPPAQALPEHDLVKKGKASTLKEVTTYLLVIEILLMLVLMYQSIKSSGASGDPPYLPIMSFFFILMLFMTIINLELMPIHVARIRWTTSEREAIYHVADYSSSARIIVVLAAFFVVFLNFMSPIQMLDDSASSEDTQTDDGTHSSFSYKFTPYDPMGFTETKSVKVDSSDNVRVFIYFFKTDVYEAMGSNVSYASAVDYSGKTSGAPAPVTTFTYDGKLPREDITVFAQKSDPNTTMNVKYTIKKEVNRDFFSTLNLFMIMLMVANICWAVVLVFEKHRIIKMYVKKEQAKLERVFTVEDVFLIYGDGRLIAHNTRRIKPDVDKDIMTGMLTAVQNFVKESFEKDESGSLDEMHYGNLRIMIENGEVANLAVVVNGEEPRDMRERMKYLLEEVNLRFGALLKHWDGDISQLAGVKEMIGDITPVRTLEVQTPIEEAFLFHRDKRFVAHATKRLGPDVDDNLLLDTLEYIQESVKDPQSVPAYGTGLSVPYGEWHIAIEFGGNVFMSALMSERETPEVREQMRRSLKALEDEFGPFLYDWNGEMRELTGLKKHLEGVFIASLPEKRK